jgi:hypothetical protein
MYFDAVITDNYVPVFNGTPEETRQWLVDNHDPEATHIQVCVGATLKVISIAEYLTQAKKSNAKAR